MIKILVVDDEKEIRRVLFRIILAEGYDCKTAENGYDAIRILPIFRPEIVIMGYRMPGVNGIEFLNFIQQHYSETQVILLRSDGELEIAIDAVTLGAYAFFRKPLELEEILTALGQISNEVNEEIVNLLQRGNWIKKYARLKKAFSPPFSQLEKLTGASYDHCN